ncbi:hypothetical protein ACVFI8_19440 [Agarivorans sp. MS3-6]
MNKNLINPIKKTACCIALMTSCSLLLACGGGGSGAAEIIDSTESNPVPDTPPIEEIVVAPSPEPVVTRLEELQVAESFTFSNQQEIQLTVYYPYQASERAYLNICTQWKNAEQNAVDYDSCLWRGQISQTQSDVYFSLPAHASYLVAEVWQVSSGDMSSTRQTLDLNGSNLQALTFSF